MKNFKILALVAVAAVAMMSCGSLDSKISDLDKACRAGDLTKAQKISAEIASKYEAKDFSQAQVEKMAAAEAECVKSQMGGSLDFDE